MKTNNKQKIAASSAGRYFPGVAVPAILVALALMPGAIPIASGALVIGSFDTNRADVFSPSEGSAMSAFRGNIVALAPSASFKSTNLLTGEFLSSVNLLVLTAVEGSTSGITPLSAAEQQALTNYVAAGGSALIFTDNDIQFEAASESLAQPFGLDSTGNIPGSVNCTVTNLAHPVANGPFGAISNYTVESYPGWYDVLPPTATAIAILNPNNQVSIAAIAPGKLGPGSGGVVFFSDSTIDNGAVAGGTLPLVDNAIDFLVSPSLQALPILSIAPTNTASVVVWWPTNFVGFRLLGNTDLSTGSWQNEPISGVNLSVFPQTNAAAFFKLIKP